MDEQASGATRPAARGAHRPLRGKSRTRLERELKALRALQARHRRGDIVWALATVGALAALWMAFFLKFSLLTGSLPFALAASVVLGAGVWWIGRRAFILASLIVVALAILVFEDCPDLPESSGHESSATAKRRAKLEGAIRRREALLRRWREPSP